MWVQAVPDMSRWMLRPQSSSIASKESKGTNGWRGMRVQAQIRCQIMDHWGAKEREREKEPETRNRRNLLCFQETAGPLTVLLLIFPFYSNGLLTRMCDYLVSCQMSQRLIRWQFVLWAEGTCNKTWTRFQRFCTKLVFEAKWQRAAKRREEPSSGPLGQRWTLAVSLLISTESFCPRWHCEPRVGLRIWVIYEDE